MTDRTYTQAEVDALVAAARENAAKLVLSCAWGEYWNLDGEYIEPAHLAEAIRALTPADARAALRAREEAAVRRALEGAAKCCDAELGNTAMLLSNPPKSSAAWDAANAIRALADNPAKFIGGDNEP